MLERPAKPIVRAYWLPNPWVEVDYQSYFNQLLRAACSVTALRVRDENDIIILFPLDIIAYGAGKNILIEADVPAHFMLGPDNMDEVASAFFQVTHEMTPDAYIQCVVRTFDVRHGYWATGMDA